MSEHLMPFSIETDNDFNQSALEIFKYQYKNVLPYKRFVDLLKVNVKEIKHYSEIPFLPIQFYKSEIILDNNFKTDLYFQSSGTTSSSLSKHYIANERIYKTSILKSFELFLNNPSQYVFLGLLPSYLERENSSLIYMVNYLMELSPKKENGYYLYNFDELNSVIKKLEDLDKKVILFGVSYALLDFAEAFPQKLKNTIIIETGGMKGRKEEITKDELLTELKQLFGTEKIYSEYSMTELLSQAYSLGNNIYRCPPWMKIMTRDIEDPFEYKAHGKSGGINIIDLANIHSCSFISTQDLGRCYEDGTFEILGRIDNSDIRGCSLLIS